MAAVVRAEGEVLEGSRVLRGALVRVVVPFGQGRRWWQSALGKSGGGCLCSAWVGLWCLRWLAVRGDGRGGGVATVAPVQGEAGAVGWRRGTHGRGGSRAGRDSRGGLWKLGRNATLGRERGRKLRRYGRAWWRAMGRRRRAEGGRKMTGDVAPPWPRVQSRAGLAGWVEEGERK